MALFNRRKSQTITELEDYYANKGTRSGMAWLMAFLSLLVTVAVIAGLFFGGRWLYRTLTDDDSSKPTVATTSTKPNGSANVNSPEDSGSSTGSVSGEVSNDDFPSVVTDEAASTDVPNTDRLAAVNGSTTTTPTSTNDTIPNTGAGEVILFALPVVATAGYMYSANRQSKQN